MGVPTRIAVYIALLAVAIPWYWPEDDARTLLGLPAWVIVAMLAGLGVALFTVWSLGQAFQDDSPDE